MAALDRKQLGASVVAAATLGLATWVMWPASEIAPVAPAEAAVQPNEAELPPVSIAKVRATRIAPQSSYPGSVVSRNDSKLAADVEGRVEWVADVGTVVKAGDVVARLDANLARMQHDSDTANVAKLTAQVRFDRAQAQRMQELMDRKSSKAARSGDLHARCERGGVEAGGSCVARSISSITRRCGRRSRGASCRVSSMRASTRVPARTSCGWSISTRSRSPRRYRSPRCSI
jgi:hypothetical protein